MSDDTSVALLARIARLQFYTLMFAAAVTFYFVAKFPESRNIVPLVVIGSGSIGVVVGLRTRLMALTEAELRLHSSSFAYTFLSPVVGGVLAMVLYVLFLSGMLEGHLFPHFVADEVVPVDKNSFAIIFYQHGESYRDYALLVLWSFIAGYSERFVTNIIGRIEGSALESAPAPGAGDKKQKGGH